MEEINEFGKLNLKLRIERKENQTEFAKKMGYCTDFISKIETGKRKVPKDYLEKLEKEYKISLGEKMRFEFAMLKQNSKIDINIENYTEEDKFLIFEFIKVFEKLSIEEKNGIKKIIEKGE